MNNESKERKIPVKDIFKEVVERSTDMISALPRGTKPETIIAACEYTIALILESNGCRKPEDIRSAADISANNIVMLNSTICNLKAKGVLVERKPNYKEGIEEPAAEKKEGEA